MCVILIQTTTTSQAPPEISLRVTQETIWVIAIVTDCDLDGTSQLSALLAPCWDVGSLYKLCICSAVERSRRIVINERKSEMNMSNSF